MTIIKKLLQNKTSLTGLMFIILFALIALLAPILAKPQNPQDSYKMPQASYEIEPAAPSSAHIFGTTENQYDLYYGLIWGTRLAFKISIIVVFFAVIIGILIGGLAGYKGGLIDEVLMRMTDIVFAVPSMVLAMVIAALLGRGMANMLLALTVVAWPSYARLIRGEVLKIKELDFVASSRAMGANGFYIFFKHILPNALNPLIIMAGLDMGYIVLTASSLSFLGLGVPAGTADWGQLVALSRNWILGTYGNPFAYWYTLVFPGGALVIFVLSWNLLGDGLRDILDPKTQKR